jgi:hypothetical protein
MTRPLRALRLLCALRVKTKRLRRRHAGWFAAFLESFLGPGLRRDERKLERDLVGHYGLPLRDEIDLVLDL